MRLRILLAVMVMTLLTSNLIFAQRVCVNVPCLNAEVAGSTPTLIQKDVPITPRGTPTVVQKRDTPVVPTSIQKDPRPITDVWERRVTRTRRIETDGRRGGVLGFFGRLLLGP